MATETHGSGSALDVRALEAALRDHVAGEVRFDAGSRGAYSTDGSNYRQVPIGVVVPYTVDAAATAVEVCARFRAPVLPRGGGTSLGGQCANTAVVIDFTKYCHGLVSLDTERRTCVVEPGIVLDELNRRLAPHGLRFGPKPSTHSHCSLGGMVGNNSFLAYDADRELMRRAGIEAEVLDAGCCGLAGNFGFERGHHELSLAIGEQGVLPAVRDTAPGALVLADGFSCRTQIDQGRTGRRALHLAEALSLGLDGPLPADRPEKAVARPVASRRDAGLLTAGTAAAVLGAAAAGAYALARGAGRRARGTVRRA